MLKLLFAGVVVLLSGCVAMQGTPTKASDDEIAQINLRLGIEYVRQQQYGFALKNLNKTIELQPENGVAYGLLGVVYTRLGEDEEANRAYQQALILIEPNSKDYAAVQNNYGGYLCDRGNYHDAEAHFLRALDTKGYESPEIAYENIGVCAKKHRLAEKAEEYFRLALQREPRMARSLFEMAELMLMRKNPLSARAYIQRYHDVADESAASLWLGVRIEALLNNEDAAERYAQSLRAKFPLSDEAEQMRMQR